MLQQSINPCLIYTHVTPILQYIGPCNFVVSGQYSYTNINNYR